MHIRDAIIHGEFAPGQRLPEANLAVWLGTSRGTIREAMRVLEDLGLVTRTAHRGPFVSLLTKQKASEIYTLRALLETFAGRMAAEAGRFDAAAIADLERRLDTLAETGRTGNVIAMVEADMKFHMAVSALAGHQMLLEHLADVQTQNRRLLAYSDLYRPDLEFVIRRHGHFLDTLRTNDPDLIANAIHEHIYEVGLDIVEKLMLATADPAAADDPDAATDADGSGVSRAVAGPAVTGARAR